MITVKLESRSLDCGSTVEQSSCLSPIMVYFGFESIPDTRTAGKIKEFSLKNIMSTSERKFDGGEITERWESVCTILV